MAKSGPTPRREWIFLYSLEQVVDELRQDLSMSNSVSCWCVVVKMLQAAHVYEWVRERTVETPGGNVYYQIGFRIRISYLWLGDGRSWTGSHMACVGAWSNPRNVKLQWWSDFVIDLIVALVSWCREWKSCTFEAAASLTTVSGWNVMKSALINSQVSRAI
jgi:hypothetical protein